MKMGIASVVLGVAGLIVITYFYYLTEESYVVLGEMQHTVSQYTMPPTLRMLLFALEVTGTVLGYFAYKSSHVKLGLLGMGLGALCLILLYGYTF